MINIKRIDIKGKKFGRLELVEYLPDGKGLFACDCGKLTVKTVRSVRVGLTKSCGCYNRELTIIRNKTNSIAENKSILKCYHHMKDRCYNPNDKSYKNYGGRGIKLCDEWLNNYKEFEEWALNNGYNDSLTIDRMDVNGNYEPNNCRWVDMKTQANNKRNTYYMTLFGVCLPIQQWAELTGTNSATLKHRKDNNWTDDEVINGKDIFIEYNNQNMTLTELSKITGVKRDILYKRYKRGTLLSEKHLREYNNKHSKIKGSEKQWENKLRKFLTDNGVYPLGVVKQKIKKPMLGFHYKIFNGGYMCTKGIADLLVCINGILIFIECKKDGGKPSIYQKRIINQVRKSGGYTFIYDPENHNLSCEFLSRLMIEDYNGANGVYNLILEDNQKYK